MLFIFVPLICYGQINHLNRIEAIEQELKTKSSEEKIMLLFQKAELFYYQNQINLHILALEQALDLALLTKDTTKTIEAYLRLGRLESENLTIRSKREEAIRQGLIWTKKINAPHFHTQALENKISLTALEKGKEAFRAYKEVRQQKIDAQLPLLERVQSNFYIGKICNRQAMPDTSLYYLFEALDRLRSLEKTSRTLLLQGDVYYEIAYHYNTLSYQGDSVTNYIDSSLVLFQKIGSLPHENKVRILHSEYLTNYDQYGAAMDELNKVIQNSGEYTSGETLGMMGLLSYYNKNFEESLDYYKKSLKKYQADNNKYDAAVAEASIAFVYGQIKAFDKALPYIDNAVEYAELSQNQKLMTSVYYAKAKLLDDLGEYQSSINYRKKVIAIHKKLNSKSGASEQSLSLAGTYIKTTQYDSALVYNKIGYEHFKPIHEKGPLSLVYKNYYTIYKNKENYKAALENLEFYHAYQDSLKRNDLQKRLNQERASLKVVEAQESVSIAERQERLAKEEAAFQSTQKRLYSFLALLFLGIILVGAYFYLQLRKSKRKIESQNQELQQLNATKDKFFSIIAHDIRSPLIALEGVGEQMDYYLENNKKEKLQMLSQLMDTTTKRLSSLLDNLLNWALLQRGVIPYNPKKININEAVENTINLFEQGLLAKNIKVENNTSTNININVDEAALSTILRNLISNAIKFTDRGGEVFINTENKDGKSWISIEDKGIGMTDNKIEKLFDLNNKSMNGTEGERGTGLGLTLVKELVELNKGVLKVDSTLGKGTVFSIGFLNI